MRITEAEGWSEPIPLARPYTIATRRIESVELVFVRITTDSGLVGLGSGSPAEFVTGETTDACRAAAASDRLEWLRGRDALELGELTREVGSRMEATPAARAAVDMALYDLFARHLELPLVDFLGRCHDRLPTSITIGIKSEEEARAEAAEYIGRGFRILKVKTGLDLEADLARLRVLRETVGPDVILRVDANQGYSVEEALRLGQSLDTIGIEFVEQPLKANAVEDLRRLPESLRARIALDESLQNETDALDSTCPPHPGRIFNIKLMKCGGITSALTIARLADLASLHVMWGCMDESAISIAAALHTAYACPATRYLDLDGSFDLAKDLAEGGFEVEEGRLVLAGGRGLGVSLN